MGIENRVSCCGGHKDKGPIYHTEIKYPTLDKLYKKIEKSADSITHTCCCSSNNLYRW